MFGKNSKNNAPKKMNLKVGDTVVVISGDYVHSKANDGKPAVGKILEVSRKEGKVIVEGVQIVTKHVKPRRQGEAGGIVKAEGAIYADKVMLYCPKCEKGVRIRKINKETGAKGRFCVYCGESFE